MELVSLCWLSVWKRFFLTNTYMVPHKKLGVQLLRGFSGKIYAPPHHHKENPHTKTLHHTIHKKQNQPTTPTPANPAQQANDGERSHLHCTMCPCWDSTPYMRGKVSDTGNEVRILGLNPTRAGKDFLTSSNAARSSEIYSLSHSGVSRQCLSTVTRRSLWGARS